MAAFRGAGALSVFRLIGLHAHAHSSVDNHASQHGSWWKSIASAISI
jgi:uncharacterized protein YcnI